MEATQESTQPCTDPRRMGYNNSGLVEEDVSDIICILHPNSPAAHDVVNKTAFFAPQHILQRDELEYERNDTPALDLALRLSSPVKNPGAGFCFGRNRDRCDLLLAPDPKCTRVSNVHFRIYLTEDGILMLEDLSTNGTIVDNCRLRKVERENSRMLTGGSVIQVMSGDRVSVEVRFVVRFPSRDGHIMQYTENMLRYFERIQKCQTGTVQPRTRQASVQPVMQWNSYGMHWTGGSVYNVTGQVGKGAFATVYKLATKQHGMVYAAKELDKRKFMKNGILDQKVDNEMKIMRDLRHPNIVQYIDHHEHDRWIYIIMEYVPAGELSTYLGTHGKIPEDMVRTIARQILHALQYLHRRKITHRDIKPDNILIASLDPLRVKLSDFGLSKVVQEETFLKTFCGTLLYCAPEVYPEYETYRRGEARKRRRLGDPPPRTSPYDQSVDMWSFGAVLYHILAGVPPYIGSRDDRGAQMLRNIMTSDADFNILHRAGVSDAGIDFVARLLNRDPQARPKERECFCHPWIADVPDVDEYEDDGVLSGPDGLSDIGEDIEDDELDASQLSIQDQLDAEDAEDGDGLAQSKRPRIDYPPADIRYPSLPNLESVREGPPPSDSTRKRLFGEINPAALPSSHALGAHVDAYEDDNFSIHDFVSSTGESMIGDGFSLNSIMSLPENPVAGSAPSLMGAENMVGQLNMNSTWHPGISTALLPVVPNPRQRNSVGAESSGRGRGSDSPPDENETPKASAFRRRIELPLPDTGSERSTPGPGTTPVASRDAPKPISGEAFDVELANTIDATTGQQLPNESERAGSAAPPDPAPGHVPFGTPNIYLHPSQPRPLLGKLTTLPGSIFPLTIQLEDRMTSWGRGPQATVCYPDPMDTRIPAYALEVTFWAPAIEAQIASGRDWMTVPGVMAILSTKTRKCIWVNDTELRRGPEGANGREGFHYGKLYSGDIITIYKHRSKFLKLQCEFYHGESARPRPESEKGFIVRKALMAKETTANQMPAKKDRNTK